MKTSIKILILVLTIIGAVSAVLFYKKTITDPPSIEDDETLLYNTISNNIETYNGEYSDDKLYELNDKIEVFSNVDKLCRNNKTSLQQKLIGKFIFNFLNFAEAKFGESTWNKKVHDQMATSIKQLRRINDKNPDIKIDWAPLNIITNTINNYNRAERLLTSLSHTDYYTNLQGTSDLIVEINSLLGSAYLKNCKDLSDVFINQRKNIKETHDDVLITLENKIDELQYFPFNPENVMEAHLEKCNNFIQEYNNNAQFLYGNKEDLSQLIEKKNTFANAAKEYYRTKVNP